MIQIIKKGSFDNTIRFLHFLYNREFMTDLNIYAQEGVDALANATPRDTGKTADSWSYKIITSPNRIKIEWYNSNLTDGIPVAILIQYGHAARNGTFVQGVDYINPALEPVFDDIADRIWSEVTRA